METRLLIQSSNISDGHQLSLNVSYVFAAGEAYNTSGHARGRPPGMPPGMPPGLLQPDPILQSLVSTLQLTVTPVLVGTGLFANITLLLLFLFNVDLRDLSSVQYLRAIACVDMAMLLKSGLIWLNNMGYRIYEVGAVCHFTTFLGDITQFLLPWYAVCLAVNTATSLCYPLKAKHFCSTLKAKVAILALCTVGIAVFINKSLLFSVIRFSRDLLLCAPGNAFIHTVNTMNHINVFLNILLPELLLVTLTFFCTIWYLWNRYRKDADKVQNEPNHVTLRSAYPPGRMRMTPDVLRMVLVQLYMFLCHTGPVTCMSVYTTVLNLRQPGRRDISLMLIHEVLTFVASCRCLLNLLYVVVSCRLVQLQIKAGLMRLLHLKGSQRGTQNGTVQHSCPIEDV